MIRLRQQGLPHGDYPETTRGRQDLTSVYSPYSEELAWDLVLCAFSLEILNNFILEFVFCKSSLMGQ